MRKALALLLVLLLSLSLFACGSNSASGPSPSTAPQASASPSEASPAAPATESPSASPESKYGGILKIVNAAEGSAPIGIPWAQVSVEQLLLAPFFESLYLLKTNGELEPCLATSYSVDMEKKEVVVNIQPNVKFSDGSALTADVAGWNIMKQVEAKIMTNVTGYETRGDLVLVLKFDQWANTIITGLSTVGIVSKESFEKNGEEWAKDNPVGTGPFIMQEYVHGQYLKAVKNPNYWREGKPYLDGVEFDFIRDTMMQNMAIQSTGSDGIDVLNINSAEQISQLKASGQFDIVILETGPVTLTPSSMDPNSPLSKLEVRQAISYAIDRDAIVAARGFGVYSPATQLLVESSKAHLDDSNNLTYDVQKAKDLLAQAGYPDGFKTTLYAQPGIADKDVVQAVQLMLSEVGITADVQFPDAGGHATLRNEGWDGIIVGGFRNFANPYLTFFLSFDPFQMFTVSAARPENWMGILFGATAPPEPDAALYADAHKALLTNLTTIPVYNMSDNWAIKKNVHDTHYGEYERCNLESAWISK